jgi:hypothetical protein
MSFCQNVTRQNRLNLSKFNCLALLDITKGEDMKLKLVMAFAVAALMSCSSGAKKTDEGSTTAATTTETPAATTTTTSTKTTTEDAGATHMGSMMDKEHMQAMMKECMDSGKKDKECRKQTMDDCEKNMDKKECKKMMKQMAHAKKDKKTKTK